MIISKGNDRIVILSISIAKSCTNHKYHYYHFFLDQSGSKIPEITDSLCKFSK